MRAAEQDRPSGKEECLPSLNGEWHDEQEIAGVVDDNSGGNVIYFAPGVRLSKNNWSGFVSVGLPVANDLNGLQSEPDVRLVTGVAVAF